MKKRTSVVAAKGAASVLAALKGRPLACGDLAAAVKAEVGCGVEMSPPLRAWVVCGRFTVETRVAMVHGRVDAFFLEPTHVVTDFGDVYDARNVFPYEGHHRPRLVRVAEGGVLYRDWRALPKD